MRAITEPNSPGLGTLIQAPNENAWSFSKSPALADSKALPGLGVSLAVGSIAASCRPARRDHGLERLGIGRGEPFR